MTIPARTKQPAVWAETQPQVRDPGHLLVRRERDAVPRSNELYACGSCGEHLKNAVERLVPVAVEEADAPRGWKSECGAFAVVILDSNASNALKGERIHYTRTFGIHMDASGTTTTRSNYNTIMYTINILQQTNREDSTTLKP